MHTCFVLEILRIIYTKLFDQVSASILKEDVIKKNRSILVKNCKIIGAKKLQIHLDMFTDKML